jgi:hypothetical protein
MDFLSRFCLMRVSDIAESWETTAHFVEELIAKHELPVVLLDGQIRICVADAIAWVDRNKTTHEDVKMPREA